MAIDFFLIHPFGVIYISWGATSSMISIMLAYGYRMILNKVVLNQNLSARHLLPASLATGEEAHLCHRNHVGWAPVGSVDSGDVIPKSIV